MNIDELTICDFKKLVNIFSASHSQQSEAFTKHIGSKVIIRTYASGVHYGTLERQSGRAVELSGARRLYEWKCKEGISLSALALHGASDRGCKFTARIDGHEIYDMIEVIPASKKAIESIEGYSDAIQSS